MGIVEEFAELIKKQRRVFVSYHHRGDQAAYDMFSNVHGKNGWEIVQDRSLRDAHDSEDPRYIMQSIRDNYITGSSCTIVLCGAETHGRKYVDWEIKATLDKQHGLIGVQLPSLPYSDFLRKAVNVPARLHDNIESGYALWLTWEQIANPLALKVYIEDAVSVITRPKMLIRNGREMMRSNTAGNPPPRHWFGSR